MKDILTELQSQRWFEKLGFAIKTIVRKRTATGVDVDGKQFKKYSEPYARKRKRAGLQTHPVNLSWDDSFGMLYQITHEVFADYSGVEVFFGNADKERIAVYHNISGAGKSRVIRKFWGLNQQEIDEVFELAGEQLSQIAQDITEEQIVNVLKKLEVTQ